MSNDEQNLVSDCLQQDEQAIQELTNCYYQKVIGFLIRRGATVTQAQDMTADLWGDLLSPSGDQTALLARYRGQCPLSSWLYTVATHRFIDSVRKKSPLNAAMQSREDHDFLLDAQPSTTVDESLDWLRVLHEAVREGLLSCEAEDWILLKLVYIHGLSQHDVACAWGWNDSKMSRRLTATLETIRKVAIRRLKELEPHFDVSWPDLLQLCQAAPELFSEQLKKNAN